MTITLSTYEQSAIDFLTATNTEFKAEFERFDFHFDDDKHKRNIFKITLKNAAHKYSFSFGSSLNDSLKNSKDVIYDTEIDFYYGLKYAGLKREFLSYSAKYKIENLKTVTNINQAKALLNKKDITAIYDEFKKANTNKYQPHLNIMPLHEFIENAALKLWGKIHDLKVKNFGEGVQNDTIIPPTAYDVLASITKYDVGTFDNFCSEFGYDADSRKAYKTYKAVMEEWKNIELLFTPDQLEQLQEIN
jgi:hypothetical protein